MGTVQFGLPYPDPDRGTMRSGDVVVHSWEHTHPADDVGTMRASCPACRRLIEAWAKDSGWTPPTGKEGP
jgi:hypothetical protein